MTMSAIRLLVAAGATALVAAGPANTPSIPELMSRGMQILSDEDVLREFPGSTFEVLVLGVGPAYVEAFGRNGLRRIVSTDKARIPDGLRQWWVRDGRLCLAVPDGEPECGRAVGRIGESFYRLGAGRVIAEMRRIEVSPGARARAPQTGP